MTRSISPLAIATGVAALAAAVALTVVAQHATWPSVTATWTALERVLITLTATADVAVDRVLAGDPCGALRALGALVRG